MILICGADNIGKKILEGFIPGHIDGFTDCDKEKKTFCGLPVYYPLKIPKKLKDATFIISVMNIKSVVDVLEKQGIESWVYGGDFLEGNSYEEESVRIAHKAHLKGSVFMRSLDIMITERCSLKCRDCSNLMQYFTKPKNYDIHEVINSVDNLLPYVDEILEARIMGGDAFMHPDWASMAEHLVKSPKIRRVVIYTNGVIMPKYKKVLSLSQKVIFSITDYGKLSKNLSLLVDLCDARKIKYIVNKPDYWIDCASIKKHNRTEEQNDKLFQECVANNLLTLVDGRLFRCPFAASLYLLGVEKDPFGYMDSDTGWYNLMKNYIDSGNSMSACDYCTSRILTNKIKPAVQIKEPRKI